MLYQKMDFENDPVGVRKIVYENYIYSEEDRDVDSFTEEERAFLRPIAESLSMLDGVSYITTQPSVSSDQKYEQYLPDAWAVFLRNGGKEGLEGEVSWMTPVAEHEIPAVKEAWDKYQIVKKLASGNKK